MLRQLSSVVSIDGENDRAFPGDTACPFKSLVEIQELLEGHRSFSSGAIGRILVLHNMRGMSFFVPWYGHAGEVYRSRSRRPLRFHLAVSLLIHRVSNREHGQRSPFSGRCLPLTNRLILREPNEGLHQPASAPIFWTPKRPLAGDRPAGHVGYDQCCRRGIPATLPSERNFARPDAPREFFARSTSRAR